DLVAGLPKFKYHKEHLCPSCEQGKSKIASHPLKPVPNSRQRLHLLHMDLYRPMRITSINGKQYILVIVDDYSRYMWVHFLRSKDEAPAVIISFLKRITVLLQYHVIIIRPDNGTKFKNQVLKVYFDSVGISHQMSSVRTPQQNGVVERRNQTLVETARTMLIFSRAPLFLWAEAIATACFTQNRSIIHRRFNKTPYKLINGKKLDISFLYVFCALCYPKNDREDIRKLGAKGDIGFFIGYSSDSCAYKIYNRRAKKIMETMNVSFDELPAMAFEQRSSKPGLQYADYAGCKDTFKSTSGGAQFLGERLVSWSLKKQDCTALSTAEAEYVIRRWCYNLTPAESKFKTPMLDHQDKYMMKAQVHVLKFSAISDEQPLPRRKYHCQHDKSIKCDGNDKVITNLLHLELKKLLLHSFNPTWIFKSLMYPLGFFL
nr:retrovirus-related Pol polyprotein from transposon TNT 1-94 [Tanacetum cinerariifolium]